MMRLNTVGTGSWQARNAGRPRQLRNLALAGVLLLGACGQSETDRDSDAAANAANPAGLSPGRVGLSAVVSSGSFAAVSADESRAAEIGRDILQSGGNATDAATAMYFALAVTLPSAAGLGASGACIVHDDKTKAAEAFVFPPIAASGTINGQSFSVPSGVRGVMLTEGDIWTQNDLAGTLGAIRQRGGGEFFQGTLARTLSDQVSQMGGSLPLEALRNAVPKAGPPVSEGFGTFARRLIYVAPPPAAGALALAGWKGQAPVGPTPADSGGFSSLVAVDGKAGAAACALSMGQLFGARMIVPATGVLLAAPTPDAGSVSPVIIANPSNGEFTFAGAGGGSPTAAQATGAVARATVEGGQKLTAVLQARQGQGGTVNVIVCPSGLRSDAAGCAGASDPTGAGLALPAVGR